jgi:hypothetical protein
MSTMYFAQFADVDGIIRMIRPKISALIANSPRGITIDVKKTQRNRTTEQNRYLFAIYKHIVEFYEQTGFIPDNLPINGINSDFLHQYFKARFDVKETKNMNTVDFCGYTDKIQLLMIEQTKGNYDPIYPEEPFQTMD